MGLWWQKEPLLVTVFNRAGECTNTVGFSGSEFVGVKPLPWSTGQGVEPGVCVDVYEIQSCAWVLGTRVGATGFWVASGVAAS